MQTSDSNFLLGDPSFQRGDRRLWLLGRVGVVHLSLGAAMIAAALAGTMIVQDVLGAILCVCGAFGAWLITQRDQGSPVVSTFLLSLLMLLAGAALVWLGVFADVPLTTAIAAYFGLIALARLWLGWLMRDAGGIWLMGAGLSAAAFCAAVLLISAPQGLFIAALLVGLDLMLWGSVLLILGAQLPELGQRDHLRIAAHP